MNGLSLKIILQYFLNIKYQADLCDKKFFCEVVLTPADNMLQEGSEYTAMPLQTLSREFSYIS